MTMQSLTAPSTAARPGRDSARKKLYGQWLSYHVLYIVYNECAESISYLKVIYHSLPHSIRFYQNPTQLSSGARYQGCSSYKIALSNMYFAEGKYRDSDIFNLAEDSPRGIFFSGM